MSDVLLYCDLLGIRELWRQRGLRRVERRFNLFESIVDAALRDMGSPRASIVLQGEMESDSVVLTFRGPEEAILTGMRIWRRAFEHDGGDGKDQRLYIRGVIVGLGSSRTLRQYRPAISHSNITRAMYASEFLDAVAMEKSGFRGMRLLVDERLLDEETILRTEERLWATMGVAPEEQTSYSLVVRIPGAQYPESISYLRDVLWPMTAPTEFGLLEQRMNERLHSAKGDRDERLHARNTTMVFREVRKRLNR